MGKEALGEMAETLGKFAGLVVKELGGTGKELVAGFKKGWRQTIGAPETVGTGKHEER